MAPRSRSPSERAERCMPVQLLTAASARARHELVTVGAPDDGVDWIVSLDGRRCALICRYATAARQHELAFKGAKSWASGLLGYSTKVSHHFCNPEGDWPEEPERGSQAACLTEGQYKGLYAVGHASNKADRERAVSMALVLAAAVVGIPRLEDNDFGTWPEALPLVRLARRRYEAHRHRAPVGAQPRLRREAPPAAAWPETPPATVLRQCPPAPAQLMPLPGDGVEVAPAALEWRGQAEVEALRSELQAARVEMASERSELQAARAELLGERVLREEMALEGRALEQRIDSTRLEVRSELEARERQIAECRAQESELEAAWRQKLGQEAKELEDFWRDKSEGDLQRERKESQRLRQEKRAALIRSAHSEKATERHEAMAEEFRAQLREAEQRLVTSAATERELRAELVEARRRLEPPTSGVGGATWNILKDLRG